MPQALSGLDHLIIGVRDLEAARRGFARLGFNTTPRGRHEGWGTANSCIMFERHYLELLSVVDPTRFTNGLDRFLEGREGGLGLALVSTDAEATAMAWRAAGLQSAECRELGRILETDEGAHELRFENVLLDPAEQAGLNLFACRHLTPEHERRPEWLAHPVGAVAVRSISVLADDLDPLWQQCRRLFDTGALTRTDRMLTVHLGDATFILMTPEDATLVHGNLNLPEKAPQPRISVVEIVVRDLERAREFLEMQRVRFEAIPFAGGLAIEADEAHGIAIELSAGR